MVFPRWKLYGKKLNNVISHMVKIPNCSVTPNRVKPDCIFLTGGNIQNPQWFSTRVRGDLWGGGERPPCLSEWSCSHQGGTRMLYLKRTAINQGSKDNRSGLLSHGIVCGEESRLLEALFQTLIQGPAALVSPLWSRLGLRWVEAERGHTAGGS